MAASNRRAALAALLAFLDRLDVEAHIDVRPRRGGGLSLDLDPPPLNPSQEETGACEADILTTLREVGHRVTTTKLLAALEAKGRLHGESTVRNKLAQMVRDRKITSDRAAHPPGYGLPE